MRAALLALLLLVAAAPAAAQTPDPVARFAGRTVAAV